MTTDRLPVNYRPSRLTNTWLEDASGKLQISKSVLAKQLMLLARHNLDGRYHPFVTQMVWTKNRHDPNPKSVKNSDDFENCCNHIADSFQQFILLGLQADENSRCGAIFKIIWIYCNKHDNNFQDFDLSSFGVDLARDRLLEIARQHEPRMMS
jgi:hypothetical protein